jgi:hypothetical protein
MDYGRENVKWRHSHFIWLIKTVLVLFADASCFKLFQPVPLKYLNEHGKENKLWSKEFSTQLFYNYFHHSQQLGYLSLFNEYSSYISLLFMM